MDITDTHVKIPPIGKKQNVNRLSALLLAHVR
jgi:hypothetical protein